MAVADRRESALNDCHFCLCPSSYRPEGHPVSLKRAANPALKGDYQRAEAQEEPMKLKVDEKGAVALENGIPLWTTDDGKDIAYDVPKLLADMVATRKEAEERRKKIQFLEEGLKVFDGIEAEKAREALKTVQNLSDKKMIDAGEAEKLRQQVADTFKKQLEEKDAVIKNKDSAIRNHVINQALLSSKFITEKTILPPPIALEHFGKYFDVQDNNGTLQVVAKGANGVPINSPKNPMEIASPDEALEVIIESSPFKSQILRAPNNSGGGSPGAPQPPGQPINFTQYKSKAEIRKLPLEKQTEIIVKLTPERYAALPDK
jgi:hypothetical protein